MLLSASMEGSNATKIWDLVSFISIDVCEGGVRMKYKLINESGEKTFALIFEKGDEVITVLRTFATEQQLLASHFRAIGALRDLVLGFFDRDKKEYKRIPISEQVEVLSLTGDITLQDRMPQIHAHVVVGKSDGSAYGGHLLEGHVFPTVELVLLESPKNTWSVGSIRKQAWR